MAPQERCSPGKAGLLRRTRPRERHSPGTAGRLQVAGDDRGSPSGAQPLSGRRAADPPAADLAERGGADAPLERGRRNPAPALHEETRRRIDDRCAAPRLHQRHDRTEFGAGPLMAFVGGRVKATGAIEDEDVESAQTTRTGSLSTSSTATSLMRTRDPAKTGSG